MPDTALPALTRFVMLFALPPWLYQILSKTPFGEIANFSFLGLYTLGSLGIFAIGFVCFRFLHRESQLDSSYYAQACAMPNSGYLGVPMLAGILGPAAAVPVTLCLLIELLIIAPLTIFVGKQSSGVPLRQLVKPIIKGIFTNSLIIAAAIGVAAAFFQIKTPGFIDNTLTLLARGASPAALFAIGLALSQRSFRETSGSVWSMTLLKLVVHPSIVFVLMYVLFPQTPLFAMSAVLVAAMPIAANAYMLGIQGRANVQGISTAILISSTLAVASFTAVLAYLQ